MSSDSPRKVTPDLDDALDAVPERGGRAGISDAHGETEIEVAEVDKLGVRVRAVRVRHEEPRDVVEEVAALPERLRHLGEELEPVEVDPELGGGVLRTRPEEMRDREFFEVGVRPDETEIRRYRVGDDGHREASDWTMTRDQLRRLVEKVREP